LIIEDPTAGPPLEFRKLQNRCSPLVRYRQAQRHHLDNLLMVKVSRLLEGTAPIQHIRRAQGIQVMEGIIKVTLSSISHPAHEHQNGNPKQPNLIPCMARSGGFEPPAHGFEVRCSIH